jgi:hypothetical protein
MTKAELIDQLENAIFYSDHHPGGKWELELLQEAIEAALKYLETTQ